MSNSIDASTTKPIKASDLELMAKAARPETAPGFVQAARSWNS
jgi:hypothetical protein